MFNFIRDNIKILEDKLKEPKILLGRWNKKLEFYSLYDSSLDDDSSVTKSIVNFQKDLDF